MSVAAARSRVRERYRLLAVLLGLTAAAWVVVVRSATADVHAMAPGLGLTMGMGAGAFVWTWTVMMAGMMLPAAAPMILTFSTMQARKRDAGRPAVPVPLFVSSYLSVWAGFGAVAFVLARGADALAARSGWVMAQWPRIAGGLVVAAGLYQLSPLKDACLGKCRTPFAFLLGHWRDGRVGAFVMGLEHGLYCLGCCWLLFLVLVPLGVMNLLAMAAIALLVIAEKALPMGYGLARVGAVGLVAYGGLVIAVPGTLPGGMA